MRKRIGLILLAVLVAVVLAAVPVLAATYAKVWANSMTIEVSNPNLKVYEDSACTVELPSYSWGTVKTGKTYSKMVYVKNEGDFDLVIATATDLEAAKGTLTFSNYGSTPLAIGAARGYTIQMSISATAPVGPAPFNINFNCTY